MNCEAITKPLEINKAMSKNKTNKKEKNFDAVKTMREIRDHLSKEIMHMTFAEEKAYLKKLLSQKSVN